MKTKIVLLCTLAGCCLWNCNKVESYSEIPEIHFRKLTVEDRTDELGETSRAFILSFSFVDGDGNIGVRPGDSISKIHYTWFKKLDGAYEPFQFPNTGTVADSIDIPYNSVMNKDEAQNKTLKGTIQVVLSAPNEPQDVDTMRIGYHIFDCAGNKSNEDVTPDFSILNPPSELSADPHSKHN